MSKLRITFKRETELIDKVFSDMSGDRWVTQMQMKIFKAIYVSKMKVLFGLIVRKLGKWKLQEGKDYVVTEEQGEDDYIIAQREKLVKFLESSEDTLKKDREYQQFKNERAVTKVLHYLKHRGRGLRDKAISAAIGGGDIMTFLQNCGITVTFEILP